VKKQYLFRGLFYGLLMAVMVLSLLPIDHPTASPNDKVNHLITYGVLMLTGYFAHQSLFKVALFVIGWGLLIEVLQGQTSYRMLSYADGVANTAGVLLACAGIVGYQKIKNRHSTR
jgi:VanZ family protein